MGVLYICATPIGNLEDITLRAIHILKGVDIILAEDTRTTQKLLNHYGIKKPLIHYDEHNHNRIYHDIIRRISEGEEIAIVSEAGTPGISDPGSRLIAECIEHGISVVPIPGPCALATAMSVSGVTSNIPFLFLGFLSSKSKSAQKGLLKYGDQELALILYETPHKIKKTLELIKETLGNRNIIITRELTKIYEEVKHTTIEVAISHYNDKTPKGEFTLIILPDKDSTKGDATEDMTQDISIALKNGTPTRAITEELSKRYNVSKKTIYQMIIENK